MNMNLLMRYRRWHAVAGLIVLVTATLSAHAAPAAPVGLIVRVAGEVQTQRAGWVDTLRRYDTVAAGEVLRLAPGAEIDVLFPSARAVWTARAAGAAVRVRADAQALRAVDRGAALVSNALPAVYREVQVDAGTFAQAALVMRGDAPQPRFQRAEPVLLLDHDVTLDWHTPTIAAGDGAPPLRYTVELMDAERRLLDSREQTATSARWVALAPGQYVLRVSFVDPGGRKRANVLRFAVATPERAAALRTAVPAASANEAERAAYEALRLYFAATP